MNAPIADSAVTRRHPPLDSDAFDALLAELTREFAASAAHYDASAEFPHANLARLHEFDLLSLTVPASLGGAGASLPQALKVVRAVARGEPSTALVVVMQYLFQFRLQCSPHWPVELRERVAREAVRDGALINSLRVEPELGSPARGGLPSTVAKRSGDGWLIDGSKLYSTGSPGLTWLAVWARSDETPPRVGVWLVPRDAPGVRVGSEWNHLGMRATGSHELVFDNVFVPAAYAVDVHPPGEPGAGLDAAGLAWMSVLLSAVYDGVARAARDWFAQWASTRRPGSLGAPLASLPAFQQTLGQIDALLFSNRVLLDASAQAAQVALDEAPLVKYTVTNQSIEAVQRAIEASGNPGLSRDNPLERHYRDVLCARIHTPQNDSVLQGVGRAGFAAILQA
ncbi:acyl-CoA dehydrogenase family protein [Paraburkholderia bryophila]|uniref:Alkylation response protein AidB-like acyl-CoA dehydrogenase n=1 Tax=Paraburkholderia bryophila TaxID=420952 RepID=A0A7Z0B600_9BURK|nr:acyl-CoA dehydrogenase family protein [Paraburkholderia bryophila]NYH21633.1 alkylation response protein AidB-like acyl-CoA dehydrogenase [Paraburkholderia bryophila]